jgi:hypothetical protein
MGKVESISFKIMSYVVFMFETVIMKPILKNYKNAAKGVGRRGGEIRKRRRRGRCHQSTLYACMEISQ